MDRVRLDQEIEQAIHQFVEEKREELKKQYPNVLMRDDTLKLLDQYCTVIYYPLEGETNNGFHIDNIPTRDGRSHHFVFLNTAQTLEKQVFTAAHELGHVWKVDAYIKKCCPALVIEEHLSEAIMNRFAAELLMPAPYFMEKFEAEGKEKTNEDGAIRVSDMLRIIAAMMNHFFVPWKSAVIRFQELNILSEADTKILLGEGVLPLNLIEETLGSIKKELGYTHLIESTNRKWIEGLPELLDQAEEQQVVSPLKITELRKKFGLKKTVIDQELEVPTVRPVEGR